MFDIINFIEYFVILNDGSGIIFQPKDDNYSYILTARHVLFNEPEFQILLESHSMKYYCIEEKKSKSIENIILVQGENLFIHDNIDFDIAIIKISKIKTSNKILISSIDFPKESDLLIGYPKIIRENIDDITKMMNFEVLNKGTIYPLNNLYPINLLNPKDQSEIEGYSGGGLIEIDGNYLILKGIISRLPYIGAISQLKVIPSKFLHETIFQFDNKLEDLTPYNLNSFSYYIDNSFAQYKFHLKKEIINSSKEIVQYISPLNIIEKINIYLLFPISNQYRNYVNDSIIWISWFQFLSLRQNLLQLKFENNMFNILTENYKLIYVTNFKTISELIFDIYQCDDFKNYISENCNLIYFTRENTIPIHIKNVSSELESILVNKTSVRKNELFDFSRSDNSTPLNKQPNYSCIDFNLIHSKINETESFDIDSIIKNLQ